MGAGFGCRILFGFAAFQDKFHGARGAPAVAGLFVSEKTVCFLETLSRIIIVMGRQRQRRGRGRGRGRGGILGDSLGISGDFAGF